LFAAEISQSFGSAVITVQGLVMENEVEKLSIEELRQFVRQLQSVNRELVKAVNEPQYKKLLNLLLKQAAETVK
jgi:hypothetical protein